VQDSQVVCLKCGEFLENAEALERHTQNHKLRAKYNCERCGEFFARKQQYAKHLETHDKYSCEYCGNNFSSRRRLVIHQTKHCDRKTDEPSVTAQLTGPVQFANPTALPDRQPTVAVEPPKEKEYIKLKGKYQCRLCVYTHVKANKVVRHARCHANLRKFVCETCGVAFKAMNTLKEHLLYRHSDEKKFKCARCPKAFKVHGNLLRHAQVHTEKRDHVCHCGKRFKRSTHLRRHIASSVHQTTVAVVSSGEMLKAELGEGGNSSWADLVDPLQSEKEDLQLRPDRRLDAGHDKYGGMVPISGSAALAVVSSLEFSPKVESRERYKGQQQQAERYDKLKPYRIPRNSSSKYPPTGSVSSQKHPYYIDTGRNFGRNSEAEPDDELDMTRNVGSSNVGRGYTGMHLSPPQSQRHLGTVGLDPPAATKSAYHHPSSYSLPAKPYPEADEKQPYLAADRLTAAGGGDRLSSVYPSEFKHYMVDTDRDYASSSFDKYNGLGHDKPEYNSLQAGGGDKSYADYLGVEKSHLLTGSPEEKQQQQSSYHHHQHHHQQPLPPVDDVRLYRDGGGYGQSLDPRLLSSHGPAADLRPDPLFMDAGPADLTMTSKDLINASTTGGRGESRADLTLFCGSSGTGSPSRHHVAQQYRHNQRPQVPHHTQRCTSGPLDQGRVYPETPGRTHHFISPRSLPGQPVPPPPPADLYRSGVDGGGSRLASQPEPSLLDDPAYRSLQDLGYAVRPTSHYYDQLDSYFHPASRSLDLEGYEKRQATKYAKQEKYYRGGEEGGGRQEGGLLPPLLALVPSGQLSGHSNPGATSPPSIKLDYMCNTGDHLSSQYLPDATMDYY
jgi:KRAB domain-containing zinc finger protein